MNKWILIVAASLVVGSAALAANSSSAPLVSSTEIENAVNAMDANAYQSLAPLEYECFARNERGQTYRGFGRFPERAQEDAMAECYRHSRACWRAGCRPI